MPRLASLHSRTAVDPSRTSTSWWTERNRGNNSNISWAVCDTGMLKAGWGVVGTGDPWVGIWLAVVYSTVMMTEKCMTCLMMNIQTTRHVNQKAGN